MIFVAVRGFASQQLDWFAVDSIDDMLQTRNKGMLWFTFEILIMAWRSSAFHPSTCLSVLFLEVLSPKLGIAPPVSHSTLAGV